MTDIVNPVPLPDAPPVPQRDDPATFEDRVDAGYEFMFETLPPALDLLNDQVFQNAQATAEFAQDASAAEGFKDEAETARDKAREWAEGVEPALGSKSAMGWAGESETHSNNAEIFAAAAQAAAGIPSMEGEEGKALIVFPGANPGDPPRAGWGALDGNPGDVVFTSEPLAVPKWLRVSTSYLRETYPKTAARFISGSPSKAIASLTLPGVTGSSGVGLSPDGTDVIVLCNTAPRLRAFHESGGVLTTLTLDVQPIDAAFDSAGNFNLYSIAFSRDGQYAAVAIYASRYGGEDNIYQSALVIYKRVAGGWQKVTGLTTAIAGSFTSAEFTPDGGALFVTVTAGTESFSKYDFDGTSLTLAANPCDILPPSAKKASFIRFSPDGLLMGVVLSAVVPADMMTSFPGYALYDVGSDGVYRKRVVPTQDPGAATSVTFLRMGFTQDSKQFAMYRVTNTSSAVQVYRVEEDSVVLAGGSSSAGAGPTYLEFTSETPETIALGGPSSTYFFKQNLATNSMVSLVGSASGEYKSFSANRLRSVTTSLATGYIGIHEASDTFVIPAPFQPFPSQPQSAIDFYTYVRSYDA